MSGQMLHPSTFFYWLTRREVHSFWAYWVATRKIHLAVIPDGFLLDRGKSLGDSSRQDIIFIPLVSHPGRVANLLGL